MPVEPAASDLTIEDLIGTPIPEPVAPQPPGCPPGFICTPVDQDASLPPPVGWQIGPQPMAPADYGTPLGFADE
jgi:hypothetical protein